MKTEELTALGLSAEQAQQVLAMNGRDIERYKQEAQTLKASLETAQGQLGEASKKLEGFDPEWKAKAERMQQEAQTRIDKMRLDHAVESAIAAAHGRNARAISALIDRGALKLTGTGEVVGLGEQLEAVKKKDAYLFEDAPAQPQPPAPRFGGSTPGAAALPANPHSAANAAFRSLFGKE